jgi:hypothetical protein
METKHKVKLIKAYNTYVSYKMEGERYYKDVLKCAISKFSDWEEVTGEELGKLREFVNKNKDYLLLTYSDEGITQMAIKEMTLEREKEVEKYNKIREEQENLKKIRKQKAEERKIEKARRLLAELEKK